MKVDLVHCIDEPFEVKTMDRVAQSIYLGHEQRHLYKFIEMTTTLMPRKAHRKAHIIMIVLRSLNLTCLMLVVS